MLILNINMHASQMQALYPLNLGLVFIPRLAPIIQHISLPLVLCYNSFGFKMSIFLTLAL